MKRSTEIAAFALLISVAVTMSQGGCFKRRIAHPEAPPRVVTEPYPRFDDPDAVVFNDLPIQLYFHSQTPPAQTEIVGPVRARSTTIASAGRTCRHAGMEGLRKLQRIALQRKVDAVVNIRATWDGRHLGDDLEFGCVAMGDRYTLIWEGTLARIPEPTVKTNSNQKTDDRDDQTPNGSLRRLQSLYYQGLITREEFVEQKRKILDEL